MNRTISKNLTIFALIFAAACLTVSCQSTPPAVESTATSAPPLTFTPAPTATTSPSPELSPTIDAQMVLSQTVDGMQIDMHNIRRGDGQLKADLCHPLPDQDSWFLGRIVLKYGDQEVREWVGTQDQPDSPAGNGKMGRRCMTAAFKVPQEDPLTEFSITVESLESPPRPDQTCARLNAGKEKLAEAGLAVECQEDGDYSVNSAQSTVSEEEAQQIVHDLQFRTIYGPWEFVVRLQ